MRDRVFHMVSTLSGLEVDTVRMPTGLNRYETMVFDTNSGPLDGHFTRTANKEAAVRMHEDIFELIRQGEIKKVGEILLLR